MKLASMNDEGAVFPIYVNTRALKQHERLLVCKEKEAKTVLKDAVVKPLNPAVEPTEPETNSSAKRARKA